MKGIFEKTWKIMKIAAVFVWRNRRGGCPRGVEPEERREASQERLADGWRERDGGEGCMGEGCMGEKKNKEKGASSSILQKRRY